MVKVLVSQVIPAERHLVWSELARLEDHVEWMMDATAIRFLGSPRSGVGTRFECDTKVGPIRLTDVMEVTEWEEEERIGVRHLGVVSGSGRFTLSDVAGPATLVAWEEQLSFPWWLGSTVGARLAKPVFTALWKGNLRRLGRRITAVDEAHTAPGGERP